MTGKRLANRIAITLALGAGLCLFLTAVDAQATPIHPDIKKLVSQPPQDSGADLGPARAGWNGPEMARKEDVDNASLDGYDSAAAARAWKTALLAAATPDPGAVLGIVTAIFLLRLLRRREQERRAAAHKLAPGESTPERQAA